MNGRVQLRLTSQAWAVFPLVTCTSGMCKTNSLGTPYFEVLGCFVDESEQMLIVTDSASASRNLHEDDQGHPSCLSP